MLLYSIIVYRRLIYVINLNGSAKSKSLYRETFCERRSFSSLLLLASIHSLKFFLSALNLFILIYFIPVSLSFLLFLLLPLPCLSILAASIATFHALHLLSQSAPRRKRKSLPLLPAVIAEMNRQVNTGNSVNNRCRQLGSVYEQTSDNRISKLETPIRKSKKLKSRVVERGGKNQFIKINLRAGKSHIKGHLWLELSSNEYIHT